MFVRGGGGHAQRIMAISRPPSLLRITGNITHLRCASAPEPQGVFPDYPVELAQRDAFAGAPSPSTMKH